MRSLSKKSRGYQSNFTKENMNSAEIDSQNMMIVDDQYIDNSVVLLESANGNMSGNIKLSGENHILK